ncbi:hypothetical protein [Tsukamurella paurometabola]|uniref:Uncharacterized protein n=1 Tax=Tsukamurella paurometabola TaxID=2061 RepID=A0A3P8LE34_TSUPA|nr:hypothetical protein [Tsukamurella paurometabola]UEA81635.1 hypothetical protein LK411_14655 [Tsukamurella paurometabola]VDR38642.1 Uncharacterised protein [Tsukamurella paurometabola]
MHALSRVLLVAEADDAAEIVVVLTAFADIPTVRWLPYTHGDGTEAKATTSRIGETTVDVAIGPRALPATLEVMVSDLPSALERVLGVGVSAATWPAEGALEEVSVVAGWMRISAVSEAALIDRRGV